MNYDIHIENLGAIKEADITITPMTILAGENGTGKSFVTKFLYSVISATNIDVLSIHAIELMSQLHSNVDRIIKYLESIEDNLEIQTELNYLEIFNNTLDNVTEYIVNEDLGIYNLEEDLLKTLERDIEIYTTGLHERLDSFFGQKQHEKPILHNDDSGEYIMVFSPSTLLKKSLNHILELNKLLANKRNVYKRVLKEYITNDLKENFQISEIQDLINYSSTHSIFRVNDLIEISIDTKGLIARPLSKYLSSYEKIDNILFFESPLYWRLLPLIENPRYRNTLNKRRQEVLTGIPKHFLDLKELLFTNFKDGKRPEFIIECADRLQEQLKGKFNASNGDLTFENNQGQSISKNLVSFGMTNIGVIQAVLSKNIINKGSFVFLDEPESNLHPEWQAILANVLVYLAKNGVYVIVTTHSSDMLKAFDISTQEQEVNEELSTYYFKSDGKLLDMIDDNFTPVEMARRKLLETYEELMMRGYLL